MSLDLELRARRAGSFGAAAEAYERGRPGYPEAAIDWLLPAGAQRVLDLGAGTGKLTRQLVARGLEVVALEPSGEMRELLEVAAPQARALAGSAEAIPLPDGSVDAVLAAQAWHWVDVSRAVPEVARVLRPGGRLGLVWNKRDERVAWVAELGRLIASTIYMDETNPTVGPPFAPIERHDVEWRWELDADTLVDLVASRSGTITAAPAEREAKLRAVRELLARHPDLAGRRRLELPYVAVCSRTHLSAR